jgi:hypothetical protein
MKNLGILFGGGLILAILIWSCKENLDFRIQTDSKETVIKKFQDALDTKRSTIHSLLSKRTGGLQRNTESTPARTARQITTLRWPNFVNVSTP